MNDVMLYGYDVRTPIAAVDAAWTAERRARYLLRPEIARPLSVDRMVWPTVFASHCATYDAGGYWSDLDTLRQACADADLDTNAAVLIALGTLATVTFLHFGPGLPSERAPSWLALGWDVADSGLISGLSNCGYMDELEDVAAIRHTFGPCLNAHGLFQRRDDAQAFREVCDTRVPEHAPFLIHQLLLVPW